MKKALEENSFDLQKAAPLPGGNIDMLNLLVKNDALPVTATLIKPFTQSNLTTKKIVFIYKSSRPRRIPENALGVLVNCWFKRPFALEREKVKIIILSSLILHN